MKLYGTVALPLLAVAIAGCSKPVEQAAPSEQSTTKVAVQTTPAQQASGKLEVTPSEVKVDQKATLRFTLSDASGQAVTDATVTATLSMTMGKSQMKDTVNLKWDGKAYIGRIKPAMAGTWDVTVEAKRDGKLVLSMPSQIEAR